VGQEIAISIEGAAAGGAIARERERPYRLGDSLASAASTDRIREGETVLPFGPSFADGSRRRVWRPTAVARQIDLHLIARDATAPAILRLAVEGGAERLVAPVRKDAWNRWVPTEIPGVDMRWLGTAHAANVDPGVVTSRAASSARR
jgi:hypothetical protein